MSLRRLSCEQGILTRPDGSCNFHQGDTSVLAAVYGPGDVKATKEKIEKACVEVVYKSKIGLPGCSEKFKERLIRNVCESVILTAVHPRTAITVVIQEEQIMGSMLSCCINASCMALLDAGVNIRCMVAAVTVAVDKNGELIIDPTLQQEQVASSLVTCSFESNHKALLSTNLLGQAITSEQCQACILVAQTSAANVFQFYRDCVTKKLSNSSCDT